VASARLRVPSPGVPRVALGAVAAADLAADLAAAGPSSHSAGAAGSQHTDFVQGTIGIIHGTFDIKQGTY
jgi:hypothetical protein